MQLQRRWVDLAIVGFAVIVFLATFATPAKGQRTNNGAEAVSAPASAEAARGEYLVHNVAMCIQCHTPRLENGTLDLTRPLQGGEVPFESPYPNVEFAYAVPRIAGLPGGWSQEDLTRFLQTGETPSGHAPRPPMPPFRMTAQDAAAVAAYVTSLGESTAEFAARAGS